MTRPPATRPRHLRALGTAAAAMIASAGLLAPAAPAAGHARQAVASLVAHTTAARHIRPAAPRGRVASPAVQAAEVSASARAQAMGKPQVVTAATTPTSITVARPDGTFQMTMNVLPVRLRVHGRWQPISTRLRRDPGGTWGPVLVPSPVTLSGGGTGPLAVLYSGGRRLTVTWPRPLPAPAIGGPTATYHAAPGVVLQVTVSRLGGISLEAAARSPAALRDVRLRLGGTGLAVATRPDRTIAATARGGRQLLFSGSAPSMSAPSADGRSSGDPAASRRAAAAMTAARGPSESLILSAHPAAAWAGAVTAEVSLVPDTSSLGCSSDSGVWCTLRDAFDGISENCGSHYNTEWPGPNDGQFNEGNLVGQDFPGFGQGDTCGTNRAYYVMNTTSLTSDMRIQAATLNTWLSASSDAGCSDKWPLNLYDLGRGAQVDSTTTWATKPALPSTPYKTSQNLPGPPYCTNNRDLNFSVWDPIVSAKSNGWQFWTIALTGQEGGGYNGSCDPANPSTENCGLMRIGDENGDDSGSTEFPYVQITFDIAPPPPQKNAGGDTSPLAYFAPPDVSGLNPVPADSCPGLVFPPTGWIDSTSAVSLRVGLQALDSRVSNEPEWAKYELTDTTEGTTFPDFYSANGYASGFPNLTNTVIPDNIWDGHFYSWGAWSWVNGTGGNPNKPISTGDGFTGSDADGPYTSATPLGSCTFAIDTDPPTGLTVTSTDFPTPGTGPAGKYAGQQGTFKFSAADNPPTNCKPNPCTVASGVWGYAYSLNRSDFTPASGTNGNTVIGGSDGTATVSITPGNWGINNLYVEAIDKAGNFSKEYDYTFYAPFNPASTTTPGDVSDVNVPHVADLLATTGTGTGGLNLYNNPGTTATAWPAPTNASANGASPDGQNDWNSFDLTHRGNEFQQGSGLDDLWAIKPSTGGQPGPGKLYLYQNNPANPGSDPYGTGSVSGTTVRPGCNSTPAIPNNCTNYPPDWTTVTGILAVGDAWAGDPASGTADCATTPATNINCDYQNQSSLITADSNGTLWLYQDKGGATLVNPIKLGSTGWNNMTLLAPGQLDSGQLTLWARDNNTTDTTNYGKIFAFTITLQNGIPTLNNGNPVTATSGTALPVTAPASTYPYIATPGDAGTTGGPNLYAIDTSGNIWAWPYTASDTLSTSKVKLATVTPGTITGLY
jgi:hypothetical protein